VGDTGFEPVTVLLSDTECDQRKYRSTTPDAAQYRVTLDDSRGHDYTPDLARDWHGGSGVANNRGSRARFGNIRRLPSGRYQARYVGPDGITHKAHTTFDTIGDAEAWLATRPRRHRP
jgi:hypothetical protein